MGDGPCVHGVTFMLDCPRCLRAGGEETNAKLDHTLQAYGRIERSNADLRRENERLRKAADDAMAAIRTTDYSKAHRVLYEARRP